MSWIMTIAAGVALGYFLVQYVTKNTRAGQENDISAEAPAVQAEETENARPVARLHKSSRDKKICGVCGGIAEYLRVDSSVVRLVTILLMFGWGSGVLAYIVCALVLPEE